MPYVLYEIRVSKITRPLVGNMTTEPVYMAKPETAPDPGPVIAACNPTLALPLPPPPPPPIILEGQTAIEAAATGDLTNA